MKKINVCLAALMITLTGCLTFDSVDPAPNRLRVGVTPDSKPVIFKEGGHIRGIEADFARQLGADLGKEVVFVEIPWNKQIDALEKNQIDIIMSGMSITPARSIRINFTEPYLHSGLSALFARNNYTPNGLQANILRNIKKTFGCIKGTTGEFFIRKQYPQAEVKTYTQSSAAITALKSGKIDVFIHDAPMIWWLSAVNETELVAFTEILNVEPIAWGVRKDDRLLLKAVNRQLNAWQQEGSANQIISNWVPYAAIR